jgi:hypothetical protein
MRRPPVLNSRSCRLVKDQLWMARGSASRRSRFPRLYPMTPKSSRTSLARKRWQERRAQWVRAGPGQMPRHLGWCPPRQRGTLESRVSCGCWAIMARFVQPSSRKCGLSTPFHKYDDGFLLGGPQLVSVMPKVVNRIAEEVLHVHGRLKARRVPTGRECMASSHSPGRTRSSRSRMAPCTWSNLLMRPVRPTREAPARGPA